MAKRIIVAFFVIMMAGLALDQPATVRVTSGVLASGAQVNADCSFLSDPERFRDVQRRHRMLVSRETETLSASQEPSLSRLVSAGEIPQNNYIDVILFGKMQADGVGSSAITTDAEFFRRINLDLTGRIPSEEEVLTFLGDPDPAKRNALIDRLIGSEAYVSKWTYFFNELFRNTSTSINITRYRAGRDAFYQYLKNSIAENKSYSQIAAELITAKGESFTAGEVNYILGGNVTGGPAQDIYDGYTVQASTAFLGISSMDCLLCHDGAGHLDAINLWGSSVKRADAWGMSAFFARVRRSFQTISTNYGQYVVTESPTGEYTINTTQGNRSARFTPNTNKNAAPKYLFGGGGVNPGEDRRAAFARMLTSDPQFARALVNYIWEELMVEALVSPSNTFDLARIQPGSQLPAGWTMQAANPELLDALARDFIASGYNLRHLISTIVKSSAYQLSSEYPGVWKIEYVPYYARKYARRLDAEEIHDAIVKATGLPPSYTVSNVATLGYQLQNEQGGKLRDVLWAMDLPEPAEPRRNESGGRTFLDTFLRGDRDQRIRTNEASILQSLNLMNHTFITGRVGMNNRILNVPGQAEIPSTVRRLLQDPNLTPDGIVIRLYLNTLSRYPTHSERDKMLAYFSTMGRQAAAESLQWTLLNKMDFIYNY
jgi:hypothetical protein